MAANTSIALTSLDFDSYKSSLKAFLQTQTQFKDYDFESSNLSVLLDLLSHNTFMNAFYMNMVASEMFLDSAQLRDSIISHAKELNYLPRSFKSAMATINIRITSSDEFKNSILIPKNTPFISRVGDVSYTFSTAENVVTTSSNGVFIATGVNVYEGTYLSDTYAVNYNNKLIYKINSQTVDISSINVRVLEDNGATIQTYTRATSLFGYNETSKIFFVQPALNGNYEIVFGDGVIGRKPLNNSIVLIEYRSCNGELPNGAGVFFSASRINNESNVVVTTSIPAIGGAVAESLDSIKYNAPRAFTTQERAVTAEDYENILKINFPEINAVTAYGGEDASPPQYGRVFVSVDLRDVDGLPNSKVSEYTNFLRTRSVVSLDPIFISPEYTYLGITSNVKYNINTTGRNPEDIRTLATQSIMNYAFNNINSFTKSFYYSHLIQDIDKAEASIISNETEVLLIKYITPQVGVSQYLLIDFKTPLSVYTPQAVHSLSDAHSIKSTRFTYAGILNCSLEDDGNGIVSIITYTGNNVHNKIIDVGTVEYNTGIIKLSSFNIDSFAGTSLKVYALARHKDIIASQNVILNVVEPDINLTITQIRQ